MNLLVWKFEFPMSYTFGFQTVNMPKGAQLLSLQKQSGAPVFWALVNPEAKKVWRKFNIVPTGSEYKVTDIDSDTMKYFGTFQVAGDQLVVHVFDCGETSKAILKTESNPEGGYGDD